MPPRLWWPILGVAAAIASPAAAGPLTYAAALDLAARSAPSVQASAFRIGPARDSDGCTAARAGR